MGARKKSIRSGTFVATGLFTTEEPENQLPRPEVSFKPARTGSPRAWVEVEAGQRLPHPITLITWL